MTTSQGEQQVPPGAHDREHAVVRFVRVWGLLLFTGVAWGLSFSLAKIATSEGADPLGITFVQAAIGGAMIGLFMVARRSPLPFDRLHLQFYAFCGFLGAALPSILFFYAARHLPAGVMSIAIAAVPMMTFMIALLLGLERAQAARFTGVALGILAVVLIVAPDTSLPDPSTAVWVLAAVGAGACYAVENIYIAIRRPPATHAAVLLFGMLMFTLVFMAPIVFATGTYAVMNWPPAAPEYAIVIMSVINVICYSLFVYLVTRAGPLFASQTAYVVTLSGVAWGMLIFSEEHSMWIWGALLVMMTGLALVKPQR